MPHHVSFVPRGTNGLTAICRLRILNALLRSFRKFCWLNAQLWLTSSRSQIKKAGSVKPPPPSTSLPRSRAPGTACCWLTWILRASDQRCRSKGMASPAGTIYNALTTVDASPDARPVRHRNRDGRHEVDSRRPSPDWRRNRNGRPQPREERLRDLLRSAFVKNQEHLHSLSTVPRAPDVECARRRSTQC